MLARRRRRARTWAPAEASGRNVVLDDCVHGRVDLKVANAPIPLVFDAIALKLRLVYEERDDGGV